MKALIDPRFSVQYVDSWSGTPLKPVYATYPDSARVCQVADAEFEVAQPLFWVDCADDVIADQFYYDTQQNSIFPVVNAPKP
jgi:hypothetical protein